MLTRAALSALTLCLTALAVPGAAQEEERPAPIRLAPADSSLPPMERQYETRLAPEDHVPPPASLEQMDWLVGQWTGTGIGGAPAHESWLPPVGTTMVGTFVQEDGESGIRFTEHLYLMEEEGTLVLRLKHFDADLTGWEEKDEMLTFRLVAIEECAAYFHALTLRCAEGEDGEAGLLAAVRMKSSGEEVQELVFRFTRSRS